MIVELNDGQLIEHEGPALLKDVLLAHDKKLLRQYIGARLGGERVDFLTQVPADARLELISWEDDEAAWFYRHSLSHVLAQAVRRLFPGVKLAIGPAIEDGFYYDFDIERPFTPEDLKKIEKEMKRIVKQNCKFEREEVGRQEALERLGDEPYKLEILEDLEDDQTLTFYRDGDFVDLCRGPHMLGTGQGRFFKLLNVAGAYWRGDENNKMLQRIYGTAFASREALDRHLAMLEEAKKRDHRRLGQELELFCFDDEVGPGLPLWLPKGTVLIEELEALAKEAERKAGYDRVRTPHLAKESMFLRTGHLPYYQEAMFPPMEMEGVKYYLKPMNCPHHHKLFGALPRSYRDLPVRYAEYGTCYRYEKSGELFGLMRVRSMQMNDAHIYCTLEQFEEEFLGVCRMYLNYFELFGIDKYVMRFSTHSPDELGRKYVDEPELWKRTEDMVRRTMEKGGIPFREEAGEAAFYGPKIDVEIWSAIGREFSLATNQVDFAQPGRVGLSYTNADNQDETPICIHRAPLGTHERTIGFLIEHYAGAFPVWLAPVQAVVLPIADRHQEFARGIYQQFLDRGVRVELSSDSQTLNYRIRRAQMHKVPYMLIAGDREMEAGQVAMRLRSGENVDARPVEEVVDLIVGKIACKAGDLV